MKKGGTILITALLLCGCTASVLSSSDSRAVQSIASVSLTVSAESAGFSAETSTQGEESSTPSLVRTSAAEELVSMTVLSRPDGGKPSGKTDSRIVYQDISGRPVTWYYSPDGKNVVTCVYDPDDIGFCGDYGSEVFLNGKAVELGDLANGYWFDGEPAAIWLDNDRVILRGIAVYTLSTGERTGFDWPIDPHAVGSYAVSAGRDKIAFILYNGDGWFSVYVHTFATGEWTEVFVTDLIDYECASHQVSWDGADNLYIETRDEEYDSYRIYKVSGPEYRVTLYARDAYLVWRDDGFLTFCQLLLKDGEWEDTLYYLFDPETGKALPVDHFTLSAKGPGDEAALFDTKAKAILLYNLKTKTVTDRYVLGGLLGEKTSLYSLQYCAGRYLLAIENRTKHYYQTYELQKGEGQE